MTQIIVTINPDADGVRCGECRNSFGPYIDGTGGCRIPEFAPEARQTAACFEPVMFRDPSCIAAERKVVALVEALREARGVIDHHKECPRMNCLPSQRNRVKCDCGFAEVSAKIDAALAAIKGE